MADYLKHITPSAEERLSDDQQWDELLSWKIRNLFGLLSITEEDKELKEVLVKLKIDKVYYQPR